MPKIRLRRRASRVSEDKKEQIKIKEDLDISTLRNLGSYPSIWHAAIDQQRWALLEKQLESYRWEVESQKSRRSSTILFGQKKDKQSSSTDLTSKDGVGRTPLHLAVQEDTKTPLNILNTMIKIENGALSQPDKSGRYVIHHAVLGNRNDEELKLLVTGCPKALIALDRKGTSAISLAIENSAENNTIDVKNQKNTCQLWGFNSEENLTWQSSQKEQWRRVGLLLDLIDSEGVSISPKEHNKLVVRALQTGAPPDIVEKMIGASRQKKTGAFADNLPLCSKAVNAIFQFNYPLSLLKLILTHAVYDEGDPPKEILRALRQGLMKHYKAGFAWRVKRQDGRVFRRSTCVREEVIRFHSTNRRAIAHNDEMRKREETLDPSCQAWFDMLKFLLVFTSTRDPTGLKSQHLLHVALSIPACPPSIIELIVAVFPFSRHKEHPISGALPIHTACSGWKAGKSQEASYSPDKVLKMMIVGRNNGHFVWRRFENRLPIHHAVAAGKDWQFIKTIVGFDHRTLLSRDPQTKLFPFQQAALSRWGGDDEENILKNKRLLAEIRGLFKPSEWQQMETIEQEIIITRVASEQDREQVRTVFELLKANPDAIGHGSLVSDASNEETLDEASRVSSEFLSWLYLQDRVSGAWLLDQRRLDMLVTSIQDASIFPGMASWWNRLMTLIWESYSGEFGLLKVHHAKYLLHCAISNPDTHPIVIHLLVKLSPQSVLLPFPGSTTYPIHVAAAMPAYIPKTFEKKYGRTSLEILFLKTPPSLLKDNGKNGRSVLEIAIASGKSYREVRRLIKIEPQACLRPDRSETGLLPFQLMALPRLTEHQYCSIMSEAKRMARVSWTALSIEQKRRYLEKSRMKHDRNALGDIFQILRSHPRALSTIVGATQVPSRLALSPRSVCSTLGSPRPLQSPGPNIEEEFSAQLEKQCGTSESTARVIVHEERWRGLDMLLRRAEMQHLVIARQLNQQRATLSRVANPKLSE